MAKSKGNRLGLWFRTWLFVRNKLSFEKYYSYIQTLPTYIHHGTYTYGGIQMIQYHHQYYVSLDKNSALLSSRFSKYGLSVSQCYKLDTLIKSKLKGI